MILKSKLKVVQPILIKEVDFLNSIPYVWWAKEEVDRINFNEGLQFTVVGKFSYCWLDLEDFKIQLSKQLNIKGDCKIRLLRNRHILMRFDRMEDFFNVLAKKMYYINARDGHSYQMRPLIYDAKFKMKEEITQALA